MNLDIHMPFRSYIWLISISLICFMGYLSVSMKFSNEDQIASGDSE